MHKATLGGVLVALVSTGCFMDAQQTDDIATRSQELGESSQAIISGENPKTRITYIGGCPGAYPSCVSCGPQSCGQSCCMHEREPGFETYYPDDCSSYASPDYQPAAVPGQVCHLDVDQHWNKVTVEINVVDVYEDHSCMARGLAYAKSKRAEASCSNWTALTDGSECARRVENKVIDLVGQGYVPTFSKVNHDDCPSPRL